MAGVMTMGELMLRLTPPAHQRLVQTNSFNVYYGGAEANVAMNLAQWGHRVYFLSAFPPNQIGAAAKQELRSKGVNTTHIIDAGKRLGLYYFEEGYSLKPAEVIYDRDHSSVFALPETVLPWDDIFQDIEVFHVTGITPALGPTLRKLTMKALAEAHKRSITISFDFNYRSKLWSAEEAKETFEQILPYVDICFMGHKDFVYLLGFEGSEAFAESQLEYFYKNIQEQYDISVLASTRRIAASSSANTLTGYLYTGDGFYQTAPVAFELLERIGGGDSFASGILHGITEKYSPQETVNFAIAAGVLKHMVYGDYNQFSVQEIQQFQESYGKDVSR